MKEHFRKKLGKPFYKSFPNIVPRAEPKPTL